VSGDLLYLIHILERIGRIASYTTDGRQAFLQSMLVQDGVIRNFEVIGEAAKQISAETKQRYPQLPWRRVAGFRDVLIHGYMGVDVERVWNIVEQDLPTLKWQMERVLQELEAASLEE
jgi:uncharacterized protein with HEPN domain